MDVEFAQGLCFDPADSMFVLGETFARRKGEMRSAWLVCVIHRRHGEFTHLYRAPAVPTGGRRDVELLGVWTGACLREASDRVSTMLVASEPTRQAARGGAELLRAA